MSHSKRTIVTKLGAIECRESGQGRPVFFVHGFLMNGNLWNGVAGHLPEGLRVIQPDLPLGGHRHPANPEADLSIVGVADAVLDIIEQLDLNDVTLVGNDTGGAVCQYVITRQDDRVKRIGRLFLTNCDAFEYFPPWTFGILKAIAQLGPATFSSVLAKLLHIQLVRRVFFWTAAKTRREDIEMRGFLGNFMGNAAIRNDTMKVLIAMRPELTLEAASRFGKWNSPVHVFWGRNDWFFPVLLGERLAESFNGAAIETIPNARLFVPLDAPDLVARSLSRFILGADVP